MIMNLPPLNRNETERNREMTELTKNIIYLITLILTLVLVNVSIYWVLQQIIPEIAGAVSITSSLLMGAGTFILTSDF